MSSNRRRGDGAAVREFQEKVRFDQPHHDAEDRYTVIAGSFVVLDNHSGKTIQIYQGADAEVRAEQHARHLRARNLRGAGQSVTGEST